ncbi:MULTISPECIES: isopentenyl-diphosphate Delta-isomerase [Atopobiaceae]|uniref:Isopentenyl-diphosphate Delta-isomerase n=1 Tax=Parafannyhessea umbonata TaxID=604330 RepID=A0A1H9P495_9ACTN|nr:MULTISPECIES: isopentenyl-diphosphate Delta-isomerase [Atopobiaceae]SEH42106.1 isopentenyl-diphosphate delta-isomerase [Parafannyhessea umbonata]SER42413.1 isopentenyl-diphosphate delta-isomerase [Parafannyhessea umbonata]SJZ55948.1 isopentenyl-diphosphate delta-isomerase [Olsenella sp. KH1P3]
MASLAELLSNQEEDSLVLVDMLDREVGTMPKLAVHEEGLLHRAFSVFLVRSGELGVEVLLQRRAREKYHSGGLLTNSVCSHPRAGEELGAAVARRLQQELGVSGAECAEVGSFVYRAALPNHLVEYEYDHVFVGRYDGPVRPDPHEAESVAWVLLDEVLEDLRLHPRRYTAWFVTACPMVARWLWGSRA